MLPKKPTLKMSAPSNPCNCGAPVTGYVDPTSPIQAAEVARKLNFDPRTMKSYFTCRHGNEFEYAEVRE